jgi:lysophospholipase L1-like esterase
VLSRACEYSESIYVLIRQLWPVAACVRALVWVLWEVFALEDGSMNPEYSDDFLHLSAPGYEAWLTELRPALETVRSHPPMSSSIPIPPEHLSRHGRR